MPRSLPVTRRYLQTLTRRIERLKTDRVIGYMPMGTGVRTFQRDLAARVRRQHRARELRAQYELAKFGLIKIIRTGKTAETRLTHDGCVLALKDRIAVSQQILSENWSCVVVFDIPEDIKTLRKSFRRFLKQSGFQQLQLSVWTSNKDVVSDMRQLVKLLDIQRWVKIFIGITQ